jgi:hypothetical protein
MKNAQFASKKRKAQEYPSWVFHLEKIPKKTYTTPIENG